jgi:hypothetical protein
MTPGEVSAMIEEVRAHGFDPTVTRCCVPSAGLPGSVKGIAGCNMSDRCDFDLTSRGGFKNKTWRPKNVGYYYKCNDGTRHQMEGVLPCFLYIQLLRNRERVGRSDIEEHGPDKGEVFQIIAMEEGSRLLKPNGEPWPETYHENVMVKERPNDPNTRWVNQATPEKPVPAYTHPSDRAGEDYERELERKATARLAGETDLERGPRRVSEDANADWELEPEPVAVPEKKGKRDG